MGWEGNGGRSSMSVSSPLSLSTLTTLTSESGWGGDTSCLHHTKDFIEAFQLESIEDRSIYAAQGQRVSLAAH